MNPVQAASSRIDIPDLSGAKHILLETYRKNGDPVRTTVWFVEDNGTLYVRAATKSGKVKRLRRNPSLKLARSDSRGVPKGTWIDGKATFVSDDERQRALDQMKQKYGLQWKMVALLHKIQGKSDYTVLSIGPDAKA